MGSTVTFDAGGGKYRVVTSGPTRPALAQVGCTVVSSAGVVQACARRHRRRQPARGIRRLARAGVRDRAGETRLTCADRILRGATQGRFQVVAADGPVSKAILAAFVLGGLSLLVGALWLWRLYRRELSGRAARGAAAARARRAPAPARRASGARRGGRRARAGRARRARGRSRRARRGGGRGCGWRRGRARRGARRARRPARRCPGPAAARRPRSTGVARAPSAPSAARRSCSARRAAAPRSALVTTSTSGTSMIPAFRNCSASPRAGLDDDDHGVRGLGDVGLGLADADGLDHHDVERGRERLRGRAGGGREPAEPLAGGHRADEDVAVGGVVLDPRPVAEQRAAAALRGRVDREHGDRLAARRATRAAARTAASTCRRPAAR